MRLCCFLIFLLLLLLLLPRRLRSRSPLPLFDPAPSLAPPSICLLLLFPLISLRDSRRGTSRFRGFETWRQNNSKVNFGSIENGCAAFDLPPEGQKKERWAISRTVNEIMRIYAESIAGGGRGGPGPFGKTLNFPFADRHHRR